MIRVRVSHLEAFRRVVQTEYGDEAALIRAIQGNPDPPNRNMQIGTAWHKALEAKTVEDCLAAQHAAGFTFDFGAIAHAHQLRGPGLRELTGFALFETPVGVVEVKGTADHVCGLTVRDAKTKLSGVDARDYESSLQYRFYLHLFGCTRFTYDLFSFKDPDAAGHCEAKGVDSFSFWAYPGMAAELAGWCGRFRVWAAARGLLPFLVPADRPEAVPA